MSEEGFIEGVCDFESGKCNYKVEDIDRIQSIRIRSHDKSKYLNQCLPFLTNISLDDPMFVIDKCNVWTGSVKTTGTHKSPVTYHIGSVIRRVFEDTFLIWFRYRTDILRHMCPIITGEFNSGLCCNPLHLRIGTARENRNDIFVHRLVKDLLHGTLIDYFCFIHNLTLPDSSKRLNPKDVCMIQTLLAKKQLTPPLDQCICGPTIEVVISPKEEQLVKIEKDMKEFIERKDQVLLPKQRKKKRCLSEGVQCIVMTQEDEDIVDRYFNEFIAKEKDMKEFLGRKDQVLLPKQDQKRRKKKRCLSEGVQCIVMTQADEDLFDRYFNEFIAKEKYSVIKIY
jgi:hypothetical protein